MRVSFPFLMTALFVLSFTTSVSAQAGTPNVFTTNLSLGSRGMQVIVLQQVLNRDPNTRIASTGPGSPGYETNYFGSLTKAAVVRFQEKYANEILAPAELAQGNGYVGFYTRTKLNALFVSKTSVTPPVTNSTAPSIAPSSTPIPTPLTQNMKVPPGVNPNTINLEYEIALVTSVGKQQGVSDEKIQQEIQNIKDITATTTNLSQTFFSRVAAASPAANQKLSFLDEMRYSLTTVFLKTFSSLGLGPVERAQAATPVVSFGGRIVFVYPCTCTGGMVWRITLAPPQPPSYATLLDAPVGTQLFTWYNSPLVGIQELGFYTPGAPSCIMYYGTHCAPNVVPGWGTITPYVGTSLPVP